VPIVLEIAEYTNTYWRGMDPGNQPGYEKVENTMTIDKKDNKLPDYALMERHQMMRGFGYGETALKRPQIGVVSSWGEVNPAGNPFGQSHRHGQGRHLGVRWNTQGVRHQLHLHQHGGP
jgi:hypothetical protein